MSIAYVRARSPYSISLDISVGVDSDTGELVVSAHDYGEIARVEPGESESLLSYAAPGRAPAKAIEALWRYRLSKVQSQLDEAVGIMTRFSKSVKGGNEEIDGFLNKIGD